MVLHKSEHIIETECETILYSKQFDKLFHHVSYGRNHSTNSQPFEDWDVEENRMDKGKGKLVKN